MKNHITPEPVGGKPREYWANLAELLDKRGVAALLSVSPRTIDSLVARGELPIVRFSKRLIRFPRAAILDAMQRRTLGVK